MSFHRNALFTIAALSLANVGCPSPIAPTPDAGAAIQGTPVSQLPGHESLGEDDTPKQGPRLMPVETYMRSYLTLFGGLAPLDGQTALRHDALFDSWTSYLSVLGLPDYTAEIPRGTQTNALMLAAFERTGLALCDRSVEHDLMGQMVPGVGAAPLIFTFTLPPHETPAAEHDGFAARFDVLHRRFLGYPQQLASGRVDTFWTLYSTASANQTAAPSRLVFSPTEAGWAAVCYGLVRHPEFHLY